jgi:hypothetical protein
MRAGGFSLSRRPPPRAGPPPPRPLLQAGVYAWPPNLARPRDPPVQPARCVFVCAPLATTRPVRGGNTTPPNPTQQPYSRPPLPPLPRVPLPSASVAAPLRPLSLFEGRPLLLTLPPMPHSRPIPSSTPNQPTHCPITQPGNARALRCRRARRMPPLLPLPPPTDLRRPATPASGPQRAARPPSLSCPTPRARPRPDPRCLAACARSWRRLAGCCSAQQPE